MKPPKRRPAAALPVDHSWAARAAALEYEKPAMWACLGALAALMASLMAWVAVLVPNLGNLRSNPLFWLLALPMMAWLGAWMRMVRPVVMTTWLVLAVAPCLSLAALVTAAHRTPLRDPGLDLATPLAMAIIFVMTLIFALGGFAALRRSSLPGGSLPPAYRQPGTKPPGLVEVSPATTGALRVGSLTLSGTVINGIMFAIVLTVGRINDDAPFSLAIFWPMLIPAVVGATIGASVFRSTTALIRNIPGAEPRLRRAWGAGAVAAWAFLAGLWLLPAMLPLKLAMSVFTVPMALLAAWAAWRAALLLRRSDTTQAATMRQP